MSTTTEGQWAKEQLTALSALSDHVLEALTTQFSNMSDRSKALSEHYSDRDEALSAHYKTLEDSWIDADLAVRFVRDFKKFPDDEANAVQNDAESLLNRLPSDVKKVFARGLAVVSRVSGDTASENEVAGLSEALEHFELE